MKNIYCLLHSNTESDPNLALRQLKRRGIDGYFKF